MKKFARMSLVAAVAVAGLTTANAKPLEEAIKGVDLSGSMVYRFDDRKNNVNDSSATNNFWKIATTVKAPVNDYVSANVRVVTEDGSITDDSELIGLSTSGTDANPSLNVTNANFTVTTQPVTAIVGKQGLTTPWTVAVDSDGNEQTGTGILALGNAGPVTIAGGYFNQTNLGSSGDDTATLAALKTDAREVTVGGLDIYTAAVIVPVAGFTFDAWYLNLQETFDTYTAGAKGSINIDAVKLGLDARYAALEPELDAVDTQQMWKAIITADMGIFGAKLAYAGTDEDGGLTALDDDADTTYLAWNITTNGVADADLWHAAVDVDLIDTLNLAANYVTMDSANDTEDEEYYAQLTYKMSSNLSSYLRYGTQTQDVDGTETINSDRGRIQVEYKF